MRRVAGWTDLGRSCQLAPPPAHQDVAPLRHAHYAVAAQRCRVTKEGRKGCSGRLTGGRHRRREGVQATAFSGGGTLHLWPPRPTGSAILRRRLQLDGQQAAACAITCWPNCGACRHAEGVQGGQADDGGRARGADHPAAAAEQKLEQVMWCVQRQ